jgi:glycosyltransferase involved in cell wall biosynthesis
MSPDKPGCKRCRRILFAYWGRRGLSRFVFDLAHEAKYRLGHYCWLSISRQNEIFEQFAFLEDRLVPVDTFNSAIGAFTNIHNVLAVRSNFVTTLQRLDVDLVITLMPHIWTPLVVPRIRATGIRHFTIIHDVAGHRGDSSNLIRGWSSRNIRDSDRVIALSQTVARQLVAIKQVPHERLLTLFHPDLHLGRAETMPPPLEGAEPFRLLFFGRILPYKGLALLVEAVESLAKQGIKVHLGVYGSGNLSAVGARLHALGAEIENSWIPDMSVAQVFNRFHAVALPHTDASQSGVAAIAMGTGLPAIANPVGGLVEQIIDGKTGVLAAAAESTAFAAAIKRLSLDRQLYENIRQHIALSRSQRSMKTFLDSLIQAAEQTAKNDKARAADNPSRIEVPPW